MRRIAPIGVVGVCLACLGAAIGLRSTSLAPVALAAGIAGPMPSVQSPGCQDRDGDGYGPGCLRGPDCNDSDPKVFPGRTELCNFRDDNCDGEVDNTIACGALTTSDSRIKVAAGEFAMGSPAGEGANDEQPRHHVWLSGFEIDQFEVTNRRYQECVKQGQCEPPQMRSSYLRSDYYDNERYAEYPVVFVALHQVIAFCRFAGGRLPTEAEWEKSARGHSPSLAKYPWGEQEPDCSLANMGGPRNCVGDTDRVGRRPLGQSPVGAMDMAGNVWEWVADLYDADYYKSSPSRDPKGPDHGSLRIVRGGCWESGSDSLRVSFRKTVSPTSWAHDVGFRCAYEWGG